MFLPGEIHLLVVDHLELKDLKVFRQCSRQCNQLSRPRLWKRIVLPDNLEKLFRLVRAGDGFTWNEYVHGTWRIRTELEHDDTQFLRTPPVVRELTVSLGLSGEVMQLQMRALTQILPVLALKKLEILRPIFTYWNRRAVIKHAFGPESMKYLVRKFKLLAQIDFALKRRMDTEIDIQFSMDDLPQAGSICTIDCDTLADDWPSRIRTFEVSVHDWTLRSDAPSYILPRLTNLENLKIHFASSYKYHEEMDFSIPQSVTNLIIIGPLTDRLTSEDFVHSVALEVLPNRLTTLCLNVTVITNGDLDAIAKLPDLASLDLQAKFFGAEDHLVAPTNEPFPNYFKSKKITYLRIRFEHPDPMGPYINSMIRSCPNLEHLSLRWFIPDDISIMPKFCPKTKILELQYPHPLYPPTRAKVYPEMFEQTIHRLPKLQLIYLTIQNSLRIQSACLLRAALKCPDLKAVITMQMEPQEVEKWVPTLEEVGNHLKDSDIFYRNCDMHQWPRVTVFSGTGDECVVNMTWLRKMYHDLLLDKRGMGIWDGALLLVHKEFHSPERPC